MLIASKYEEMYAPEVADFVYITDNAYTKKEIRDMEAIILRALDFSVGKPLCLHFLRRNSKAGQVNTIFLKLLLKYFVRSKKICVCLFINLFLLMQFCFRKGYGVS